MSDLAVSEDLKAPVFTLDRSSTLAKTLDPGTELASKIPGAVAADKQRDEAEKAAGRELVSDLEKAKDRRTEAERLRPPIPPLSPPPQRQDSNPMEVWGSLAMGLAMLGSAFTRRPMVNSLNAAADVMKAHQKRDVDGYKTAMDRWKTENDYAIKSYEFQRDYYKDALDMIGTDTQQAVARMKAKAGALGHSEVKALLDEGKLTEAVSVLNEGPYRLEKFRQESLLQQRRVEAVERVYTAEKNLRDNPNDPAAQQELKDALTAADHINRAAKGTGAAGAGGTPHNIEARDADGNLIYSGNATYDANTRQYTPVGSSEPLPAGANIKPAAKAPTQQGYVTYGDPTNLDKDGNPTAFQQRPGDPKTAITMAGEPYTPGGAVRLGHAPTRQGYQFLTDPTRKDEHGNPTPYQQRPGLPDTAITMAGTPYKPGGAQRLGGPQKGPTSAKALAAQTFSDEIVAKTGKPPVFSDWVRFSQEMAPSQTGKLSDDAVKLMAEQYILGDMQVITSLPRGGPARIQVENEIAAQMRDIPDAAREIVMNRMRVAEAKSAATTAGRVTMNTTLYSQEAKGAGEEVIRTSALFPRKEFPLVNVALRAYQTQTGDPNVIKFGVAMNALVNAYGKMSNPTGTGIHDADKERFTKILDTALSEGQVEAGVRQVIREGEIVAKAAHDAQVEVLRGILGGPGQAAAPAAAPAAATELPPAARAQLQEGQRTTFSNGQVWTLENGQPKRVQ